MNFLRNIFCGPRRKAIEPSEVRHIAAPAVPVPCAKCGGYFRPEFLTPAFVGTFNLVPALPTFEVSFYCRACTPVAPFTFHLKDSEGEIFDTRCFATGEGWFQDVDKETGENQYVISFEDYNHAFCVECGGLIEETECQKHREKKTATKGRKS